MKRESPQGMGNHKFSFSDIMSNSWLYKLKGISRRRRKNSHSSPSPKFKQHFSEASSSRNPFHPRFPDPSSPPATTIKGRSRRKTLYKPSSRLKLSSSLTKSSSIISPLPSDSIISAVASSSDHALSSSGKQYGTSPNRESSCCEIVIDTKHDGDVRMVNYVSGFISASEPEDLTKSTNLKKNTHVLVDLVKEAPFGTRTQQKPNSKSSASGIKLRVNSPKIARKKTRVSSSSAKKIVVDSKNGGIAESFAIVLSSIDPERDFRESMVEMIVENNLREQKDLEDLLACYLSLNSSEYHDVIIKAFEKTWFHLSNRSL